MMRLASGLLVAVLLTTCVISGTFAKYVAQTSGNDTAKVALFSVKAFGETVDSQTDTTVINIFDETKVYDTLAADYAAGVDDTDIKDGTTEAIIAPGSWGTFTYNIENDSEVAITYAITYVANEAGVPLEWSVDGGNTWTDSLANVSATEIEVGGADVPVTVYWRWAFVGTDAATDTVKAAQTDSSDTTLGFAGDAHPSLEITVDFVQVD